MTYRELVARLESLRTEMRAMSARTTWTPDDEARWERLNRDFDEAIDAKRSLERQADMLRANQADISPALTSDRDLPRGTEGGADPGVPGRSSRRSRYTPAGPGDPWELQPLGALSPAAVRSRALTAVERSAASDDGKQHMTEVIEAAAPHEADVASRWALATSAPEYMSAFTKLAKDPVRGHLRWTEEERVAFDRVETVEEDRAMSLTDAQGGYLVPFQLDPSVIITDAGAANPIRSLARKVTAIGDVWHGVSSEAVDWSFDAEAAEVSDDSPAFLQPTVTVRTARGFVPISLEAYMDEANVAEEVGKLLSAGRDELEARVLVSGVAASNEPVGIVTKLTGTAAEVTGTGESLAAGGAGAITDVYSLLNGLAPRWRSNAAWVADTTTLQAIGRLVPGGSTTDVPLLVGDRLLDRPYREATYMDDLQLATVTATTRPLIVGDWSQMVLADRIGMQVEFIPHLFSPANLRPSGQRGWFAFYRMGADTTAGPAATGPFRMLKVVTAA